MATEIIFQTYLTSFKAVLTALTSIITGSTILYACFAGGLLVVGSKVFKRIKNAVK